MRVSSRALLAALLLMTALIGPGPEAEAASPPAMSAISRLYFATFDRPADSSGLEYWGGVYDEGVSLNQIAGYFVSSLEFQQTYGDVDDTEVVRLIYQNVLKRQPDASGLKYWVGLLEDGHSRGTILNGFAQSPEFILLTAPKPAANLKLLMIGDSIFHGVRLLGIPVGNHELRFMTEEGRQVTALPELLEQATADGSKANADAVVIHLGTNGWQEEYFELFDEQLAQLAPKRVYLVNTEVARPWESAANAGLARLAATNGHVALVDWNATVAPHPNWMRSDGIHPNPTGLKGLADLLSEAILAKSE